MFVVRIVLISLVQLDLFCIVVPGRVSSLKVIERGSGHLLVEWQLPVDASGPILAYEVEYRVG